MSVHPHQLVEALIAQVTNELVSDETRMLSLQMQIADADGDTGFEPANEALKQIAEAARNTAIVVQRKLETRRAKLKELMAQRDALTRQSAPKTVETPPVVAPPTPEPVTQRPMVDEPAAEA